MLGHQIDYYMKPSGITSGVTGLLLLGLGIFYGHEFSLPWWSIVFYVVGLWGTAGVIICSRYFNVVTNAMMAKWDLDNIPANYPEVRSRWDLVHTIRASHGVLGFVGYTLAALTAWSYPAV
jgi:hypothetical protein